MRGETVWFGAADKIFWPERAMRSIAMGDACASFVLRDVTTEEVQRWIGWARLCGHRAKGAVAAELPPARTAGTRAAVANEIRHLGQL